MSGWGYLDFRCASLQRASVVVTAVDGAAVTAAVVVFGAASLFKRSLEFRRLSVV